jgi:hypothetical protein
MALISAQENTLAGTQLLLHQIIPKNWQARKPDI